MFLSVFLLLRQIKVQQEGKIDCEIFRGWSTTRTLQLLLSFYMCTMLCRLPAFNDCGRIVATFWRTHLNDTDRWKVSCVHEINVIWLFKSTSNTATYR